MQNKPPPSKVNALVCVPMAESTVTATASPVRAMLRPAVHAADVVDAHTDVAHDASPTVAVGVMLLVRSESPLTVTKPPSVVAMLVA